MESPAELCLDLVMDLLLSPEEAFPVPARLRYSVDDPYAVHIAFHVDAAQPIGWYFARELLVQGLLRPTGLGDVRIWPTAADGRRTVTLMLCSPDGDAFLQAPAARLAAWVRHTLRLVPPGSPAERLRVDRALDALFAANGAPDA
ncbi:SsgA family sporulation/cell division regulator [Kitasatospora cheerisanensis]|uniref:Sporulation protein SsgA n=1 Tax=Kitasatospora cheerisanensis KCTC 2395 TaxID=1348663 RepID=A0A066ZAF5_9ACTN|nr:SsgA family sporulation/cell division regulator [Kitasatospora cheerisanensis]KDN87130.1 sporulation protein SsgA [Kitasatospora cheerisanensis KCTC 2395]